MQIHISDDFFYRIKEVDKDIFEMFNTNKENVKRNNEKIKIYNDEWVKIKINDYAIHHVKPAETLEQIATKYSLSVEEIKKDNNLTNSKLFIGQRIKIFNKKKSTIN